MAVTSLKIDWTCKPFGELTGVEMYRILQLRSNVFVVEQDCVYQDCDNNDQPALHLMGWDGDTLAVYSRILPVGIAYPDSASIGRVIVAHNYRKSGLGALLMIKSMENLIKFLGEVPVEILAQHYLLNFYHGLGYQESGGIFGVDGIPHINMIYTGLDEQSTP